MAGTKSFGVAVSVGGSSIGGLISVTLNGGDVNFIDITTQDSAGGWKEYIGGLIDGGTIDLTGNYDSDNAGQTSLNTNIGDKLACVITFSDASTLSCDVIVGKYNVTNELDSAIGFTCPLKVTGPIT